MVSSSKLKPIDPKVKPDEVAMLLYLCILNTNAPIDFSAVGRAIGATGDATRKRYLRAIAGFDEELKVRNIDSTAKPSATPSKRKAPAQKTKVKADDHESDEDKKRAKRVKGDCSNEMVNRKTRGKRIDFSKVFEHDSDESRAREWSHSSEDYKVEEGQDVRDENSDVDMTPSRAPRSSQKSKTSLSNPRVALKSTPVVHDSVEEQKPIIPNAWIEQFKPDGSSPHHATPTRKRQRTATVAPELAIDLTSDGD